MRGGRGIHHLLHQAAGFRSSPDTFIGEKIHFHLPGFSATDRHALRNFCSGLHTLHVAVFLVPPVNLRHPQLTGPKSAFQTPALPRGFFPRHMIFVTNFFLRQPGHSIEEPVSVFPLRQHRLFHEYHRFFFPYVHKNPAFIRVDSPVKFFFPVHPNPDPFFPLLQVAPHQVQHSIRVKAADHRADIHHFM